MTPDLFAHLTRLRALAAQGHSHGDGPFRFALTVRDGGWWVEVVCPECGRP